MLERGDDMLDTHYSKNKTGFFTFFMAVIVGLMTVVWTAIVLVLSFWPVWIFGIIFYILIHFCTKYW